MKNDSIREAWDHFSPTSEQKERMYRNLAEMIPREQNTQRIYQGRPVKTKWWSVLLPAAACLAVLVLGGFVLHNFGRYEPDPQLQTSPEETKLTEQTQIQQTEALPEDTQPQIPIAIEQQSATVPFGNGDYLDYVTWIRQRNQSDPYFSRDTTQYYAYYDINEDGIKDLLIGGEDGRVSEAITCIDEELSLLFSVGCDFTVCADGSIYTGREGDKHFVWYRLSGHEQFVTMTIWYDDVKNSWYQYNSQTNIKKTITKSAVQEILESCAPVELNMKNLNCFAVE